MTDVLGQVQELVARNQVTFRSAADLATATALSHEADSQDRSDLLEVAATIRRLRADLCDLLQLSLNREMVRKIQAEAASVGIVDPVERKALAEMVAGRDLERLADLTDQEAQLVLLEIQKHEEPF